MELRQRKRIANRLPRYDIGKLSSSQEITSIGGASPTSYLKQKYTSIPTQKIASPPTQEIGDGNTDVGSIMGYAGTVQGALFSQQGKFSDGASTKIKEYGTAIGSVIPGKYGKAVTQAADLSSEIVGNAHYKVSDQQMMNEAGTNESVVNGIGYTRQNMLDTRGAYKDVKSTGVNSTLSSTGKGVALGATVGSIIPGLGTVAGGIIGGAVGLIGGIFGSGAARRRQKRINSNAQVQADVNNQYQQAMADTIGLQNRYYADNYDTTGTVLFGANHGKDLKQRKRIRNKTKV